jgi:hypothetical protein
MWDQILKKFSLLKMHQSLNIKVNTKHTVFVANLGYSFSKKFAVDF